MRLSPWASCVLATAVWIGAAAPADAGCRSTGTGGSFTGFYDPTTLDFFHLSLPNLNAFPPNGGGWLPINGTTFFAEVVVTNFDLNAGLNPNLNVIITHKNPRSSTSISSTCLFTIPYGREFPDSDGCSISGGVILAPGESAVFLVEITQGPDALSPILVQTGPAPGGQSTMTYPPIVEATITSVHVDGSGQDDWVRSHVILDRLCMR